MTQEEKDLLLKDITVRLPYTKTICKIGEYSDYVLSGIDLSNKSQPLIIELHEEYFPASLEHVRPYLRPMSSMTEEERETYEMFFEDGLLDTSIDTYLDWLLEGHFDFRGLIPKNLALEAPEGMYKID